MTDQPAFEVACFVLVDDVLLGQAVNHRRHFRQLRFELLGVRGGTVLAKGIPHRFVVITVAETLRLIGADALEG